MRCQARSPSQARQASPQRAAPAANASKVKSCTKFWRTPRIGSRREMERWIAAGRVSVNGVQRDVGARVTDADKVVVDGKRRSTHARAPRAS